MCGLTLGSDTMPVSGDYTYTISGTNAIITAYSGVGGDIVIPSSLDGYIVTTIDTMAFYGNNSLTSVILPNTVTRLNDNDYAWCQNCASITLSDNLTYIDKSQFYGWSALTSIVIPAGVTYLGNWVFASCSALESITFLSTSTPTLGGLSWLLGVPTTVRGHAHTASSFPVPGESWNGLTMGAYIDAPTSLFYVYDGSSWVNQNNVKFWNGVEWSDSYTIKHWDGSSWV
jgi:hypothetical protein